LLSDSTNDVRGSAAYIALQTALRETQAHVTSLEQQLESQENPSEINQSESSAKVKELTTEKDELKSKYDRLLVECEELEQQLIQVNNFLFLFNSLLRFVISLIWDFGNRSGTRWFVRGFRRQNNESVAFRCESAGVGAGIERQCPQCMYSSP
jgi:hypothetical protein